MNRIERAADLSVRRAVGFGALAILLTVAGLSAEPVLALRTGAVLTLVMWAVLMVKAYRAPHKPYKRTELWLMLEPPPRLPADRAQRIVADVLQATFRRYAEATFVCAAALWLASLLARFSGL